MHLSERGNTNLAHFGNGRRRTAVPCHTDAGKRPIDVGRSIRCLDTSRVASDLLNITSRCVFGSAPGTVERRVADR